MSLEIHSTQAICGKCGREYGRRKGNFPVNYSVLNRGIGYTHICKSCIDGIYNDYLSQCQNAKDAVRQTCRKLDLYWSERAYELVERKSSTRSMMTQYIAKINTITYAGKSYDDTLIEEGSLWRFDTVDNDKSNDPSLNDTADIPSDKTEPEINIPEEVIAFWGPGYQPDMYLDLEQRHSYWMSRFPEGVEIDIGTEAIIRQICSLELDINRDRAAGRAVDKSINALNTLLGSASLKPAQKKDDASTKLQNNPMGVWLYKYENLRPLPDVDDKSKSNRIKKYIFTWMGHLCKMVGMKNGYTRMYEDEIERLRVEKPEYRDEDEESLLINAYSDEGESS